MAEPREDDRLRLSLDWPADDRRDPGSGRRASTLAGTRRSSGTARRSREAIERSSGATGGSSEEDPLAGGPPSKPAATPRSARTPPATETPARRQRPLQAAPRAARSRQPGARPTKTASPAAAAPAPAAAESATAPAVDAPELGTQLMRVPPEAGALPALTDRVDTLTHALITLHAMVGDRLTEHGEQLMDVIDQAVVSLNRREDEQLRVMDNLMAEVRSLRAQQLELVTGMAKLVERAQPEPPAPDPEPAEAPNGFLRRRARRWWGGSAGKP